MPEKMKSLPHHRCSRKEISRNALESGLCYDYYESQLRVRHRETKEMAVRGFLRVFRIITCFALLTATLGEGWAAEVARQLPTPLSGHPGNVFLEGEEVAVPLQGKATHWRVVDVDGGSVGQPHIQSDQLRAVLEAAVLDSRGERNMALMGFERVGTKIENVL